MWDWYSGLPDHDKAMAQRAMRIAAYGAVFGFFAALDGSRAIDDPPHGQLRLTYINSDGSEVPLNLTDQIGIQEADELHALWTGEVFPTPSRCPDRPTAHSLAGACAGAGATSCRSRLSRQ